ncbi:1-aminocyclopropane-1-carboxylate oxidase 1-like [Pyrus ussuriensis x Pyrus communis]|uniref:1-aminocyclopropane-1-carboxylate oxidase 1-like n=1 Tax=Pyrus ussuriensis x Pyrus communis TaxID=2448454 RepID=A0A5N5GW74_9ROSA|nr:1-aminocyclopropane-1-carboxylate oxidase 1-like [Pyrus ussuriensis x Pyrus communis]
MDIKAAGHGENDRAEEAFDVTMAGVKGLVDAGTVHVPRIFIGPPNELTQFAMCYEPNMQIPVIDLHGTHKQIVDEVRTVSETWGFFQVVNHGVPVSVLEDMIYGVVKFNEQDLDAKKVWYNRDRAKTVRFNSNYDVYHARAANWRDTLIYTRPAAAVDDLFIALGLKPDNLKELGCAKDYTCACHYSPACPEPELTMGSSRHSDPYFLTIHLQDQIGGLQVLHDNQWVNVNPISGGLVVNIGDLLQFPENLSRLCQMTSFQSVQHRVMFTNSNARMLYVILGLCNIIWEKYL